MKQKKVWDCTECGGPVVMKGGPGRDYEVRRGVRLAIPDDVQSPVCGQCQAPSWTDEAAEQVDTVMAEIYRDRQQKEARRIVANLKKAHGVTQSEIEDACRVTRSYLSHVLNGREASETLMQLLRSFDMAPETFLAAANLRSPKHALRLVADMPRGAAYEHSNVETVARNEQTGEEWGRLGECA